jgi:uncharacterized protein (TIGR02246 family)
MSRVLAGMIITLMVATAVVAQTQGETKAGSAASTEALAELRHTIDKSNARWVEAQEKGDPAMSVASFTEDGIMLARNGEIIRGRQRILEHTKARMQSGMKGVKVMAATVDVWLDGDTAYETGKFTYSYQDKGQPVSGGGRYVTMWKRQKDKSWKLVMEMPLPQD